MVFAGLGGPKDVKKTLILAAFAIIAVSMQAQDADRDDRDHPGRFEFKAGTLVLSRSVYAGTAATVTVGQTLPSGCVAGTVTLPLLAGGTTTLKIKCTTTTADGTFPTVFYNQKTDRRFCIT